jgi:DnaA family protein
MNTSGQMALDLCRNDEAEFANFHPGDNQKLFATLNNFCTSKDTQFIYLWGNKGAGKTHLLSACCQQCGNTANIVYLSLKQNLPPTILENLELMQLSCLDDIDAVIGNKIWEEALFHWFNKVQANGNKILIAAASAQNQLHFALPDLKSRLLSGITFQIHELSDEQKLQALQLRAESLGLELSQQTALFLLNRSERDMHTLFATLRKLDKIALTAKRRLTIQFIKQALNFNRG